MQVEGPCAGCGRDMIASRFGPPEFLAEPLVCEACAPRCERCRHIVHAAGDCYYCGCAAGA